MRHRTYKILRAGAVLVIITKQILNCVCISVDFRKQKEKGKEKYQSIDLAGSQASVEHPGLEQGTCSRQHVPGLQIQASKLQPRRRQTPGQAKLFSGAIASATIIKEWFGMAKDWCNFIMEVVLGMAMQMDAASSKKFSWVIY